LLSDISVGSTRVLSPNKRIKKYLMMEDFKEIILLKSFSTETTIKKDKILAWQVS